ncbi:hypothetical protein KN1_05280 [Stygiolobus caldivivus]|uniref:NurA domain-containing protein n=2 Tax=Stygiolobus caldivivus TaxID=2824673 RepID=A0A8D5U5F9_9CREN|nr:hypothetical protein KN1_05280 [Stygiolobus caldivivus]
MIKDKLEKVWIPYSPQTGITPKKVLAVDGGLWSKETRSGVIFIADAEAVLMSDGNIIRLDDKALIDVFRPGNKAKERASLIMQLLELQLAIKNGNKADLILLDGSISKKVGRHKTDLKISDVDDLFSLDDIASLKERESEEKMHKYLVAENQIALSILIEKYGDKVLFVSKNSKTSDIFNQGYSDVIILELFTQGIGYSEPIEKVIEDKYILSLGASKILSNLKYYTSFIRLDNEGKILRLDFLKRSNLIDFINSLIPICVRGYPYPLLEVHKDVRISREDIKRIMRLLGIKPKQEEWWPSQFL